MLKINITTLFIVSVLLALTLVSKTLKPQYSPQGLKAALQPVKEAPQEPIKNIKILPPQSDPLPSADSPIEPVIRSENTPPVIPEPIIPEEETESTGEHVRKENLNPKAAAASRITEKGATIYFASDTTTLPESSLETLRSVVQHLDGNPELSAEITGHADSLGDPRTNQIFSNLRAQSVASKLEELGLPKERIMIQAHTQWSPKQTIADPRTRQLNRKVEISYLTTDGAPD